MREYYEVAINIASLTEVIKITLKIEEENIFRKRQNICLARAVHYLFLLVVSVCLYG